MKKFLSLLMLLTMFSMSVSAQQVYIELRQKARKAAGNPESTDMVRQFSQFKLDALDYMAMKMREEIKQVFVSDAVKQYIVDLVHATRDCSQLENGASPRASICLYQGGKSLAAMAGRDYVVPEDVSGIFVPVLAHRVRLSRASAHAGKTAEGILGSVLSSVSVPPQGMARFDDTGKK